MKKLMWFTSGQLLLLLKLKTVTGLNYSSIVREGMKLLANKNNIKYSDIDVIGKSK